MKKRTTWGKLHQISRRILSLFLVVAMVITTVQMLPGTTSTAYGANANKNLKLYFENGWGWSEPAIQYWGGSNTIVEGAKAGPMQISNWGEAQGYTLTEENGFYTITLTGDFEGFQFLDMAENENASHNYVAGYNSKMEQYTGETPQELYYLYDKESKTYTWYLDKDKENTIPEIQGVENCSITVHYYNEGNWSSVCAYGGEGASWSAISGFDKDYSSWPGVVLTENAEHSGWYDLTLEKQNDTVLYCIFNNNNQDDNKQTSNICIDMIGQTSYEAWYVDEELVTEAPELWTNPSTGETPVESSRNVSDCVQLQVGDQTVDMQLYMNGVYETPVTLAAGTYEAKVLVNGTEYTKTENLTVAADGVVYFRLKEGTLLDSIQTPGMIHTANMVGSFSGIEFVGEDQQTHGITWDSLGDSNGELSYMGGGIYGRTFYFNELTEELTAGNREYKVAFDHSWNYSLGEGGGNISVTIPAGATEFTVIVDEINGKVYDSLRTQAFEVAQNSGATTCDSLKTTVSLIGPLRGGDGDWDPSKTGYEFTPISDTLYRYQMNLSAGDYSYKCVFDYQLWYEAEAGNRTFSVKEDNTRVVFIYDTVTGKLYDSVANEDAIAVMLGMAAAPVEMEVMDNANGTTTFVALADEGSTVTLYYGVKSEVEASGATALKTLPMSAVRSGVYHSKDVFFGDAAVDMVYYYDVNGSRVLDGSNPTVQVSGAEYSNYTRDTFTGRTVNVAGSFPGSNWSPTSNVMTYQGNGLYVYTFADVPAANYEYKIAFNSWDPENYGAGGVDHGDNIAVTVPTTQDVSVYYNDFTHYAVTSIDYVFADISLTGSGIAEGTKLTDDGLTGIYSATVAMQPQEYSDVKILYNDKEFPFGTFMVDTAKDVTFYFDPISEVYYNDASDEKIDTNDIYYTSKETAYKSVYGAVEAGEDVTFTIETGTDAQVVTMITKGMENKRLIMEKDGTVVDGVQKWSTTTSFAQIGEYDYYFVISNGSSVCIYADDDGYYGEGTVTDLTNILAYDLVVYEAGFETPDWMKDAVIYQIFPDRFYDGDTSNDFAQTSARGEVDYEYVTDWYMIPENPEQEALLSQEAYEAAGAFYGDGNWSNEIYGGDVEGIVDQIDYLKALGVNVIYLNPVFASISSHRYDTSDYTVIDPVLGNQGDFAELVKVAEENDMHIILDGVFNHVSDDSIYFDRYYKYLEAGTDTIGAYPYWAYVYDYMSENSVSQEAAESAAKNYFTENYGIKDYSYTGWFDVYQTTLKDDNANEVTDGIGLRAGKAVYGYEGWWGYDSMPVVMSTNGSEYQTGNWAEEIIYNEAGDSVTQYWLTQGSDGWRLDVANEVSDETWQQFRDSVKALDSEAVIVGEIWDDATKYLMGDMYDSVMNYVFRGAVLNFAKGGSAKSAMDTLERIRERYPQEAFYAMMNLVGSHDTTRVLSYLDGIDDDRKQTDINSAFPTYETTSDLAKQRQYLVALLQFTYAGAPTIYYGDEIGMVGADDPDDRRGFAWGAGNEALVTWYATLAEIREEYAALRTGDVEVFETNDSVMSFLRSDDENTMVVLANNASTEQQVTLDLAELGINESALTDLISQESYNAVDGKITVKVPAYSGAILTADVKNISVNKAALAPAYDAAYKVAERVLAETITQKKTQVTLKEGEQDRLTASVAPANVTDKTVIWSSSDPSVATVDGKGRVTAVKAGEAVIYAKAAFSPENITASCNVTVVAKENPKKPGQQKPGNHGHSNGNQHHNTNQNQGPVVIQGIINFHEKALEEAFRIGNELFRRLRSTNGSNISIEGNESIIPAGANFAISSLTAENPQYQAAVAAVTQAPGVVRYTVYEIDLTDASSVQLHQLNGYVNVTMPVPDSFNTAAGNTLVVYRLEDNGTLTRCQTTVNNGRVTFATNHFSTYIIAEEKNVAPLTSDENAVRLYLALLLLVAGSAVLYGARKRKIR